MLMLVNIEDYTEIKNYHLGSNIDYFSNTEFDYDQYYCSIFGCSNIKSQSNLDKNIDVNNNENKSVLPVNNINTCDNPDNISPECNVIRLNKSMEYSNDDTDLIEFSKNNQDTLSYLDVKKKTIPNSSNIAEMQKNIELKYKDYDYLGILSNKYYHQEFLLYEKKYEGKSELEDKLYYYILLKILEGEYKVFYELQPREKIKLNESIWASNGNFQIGPLVLSQ